MDLFQRDVARFADQKERIPSGLRHALQDTMREFAVRLPMEMRSSAMELEDYYHRVGETNNTDEILRTIQDVRSLVSSISRRETEWRLERRMSELQADLKKVAKLQEDLKEMRVSSSISLENGEKKKEDAFKQYKSSPKKVFLMMPFDSSLDDVWKGGIIRACTKDGFCCLRVDEVSLSTWITDDIKKYIETANVVIADTTGNNPNVMFELGWALAKGKDPIVIRQQTDSKVPFDVHGIRYISYMNSWSGIEKLSSDIGKFLRSTSESAAEKATEGKGEKKAKKPTA